MTTAEAVSARRAEEANAAQLLGLRVAYLPFYDAIYRADHYTRNEELFGSIAVVEEGLALEVARAAQELVGGEIAVPNADVRFYAPLGVGHHVDHQIATQAGLALSADGWDVWFYEDMPYSLIGDLPSRVPSTEHPHVTRALDQRLSELAGLGFMPKPDVAIPVAPSWERKIAAVMAYPSQLPKVFVEYAGIAADQESITKALESYHASIGDGTPAERLWFLGKTDRGAES
jgi:LmbE family N-acetylglucosaminyl deacetylase